MIIHSSPKHYGDESDGGYYFHPVFQGKTKLCAIYAQYYAIKELKRYYVNESSTSEENYESPQDKVRWVIDGDTICF